MSVFNEKHKKESETAVVFSMVDVSYDIHERLDQHKKLYYLELKT